jgi:hypothetical protein
VGEGTRLLATVMALPLVDGIFPALILAGAVSTVVGVLEVGLLVFGGSATLAVVLAEMEGSRRDRIASILAVGAPLIALAAAEAAIAPTIESALDLATFERFAALVILAVAAKTASATVGEYLPSPSVVIGLGLVASVRPSTVAFRVVTDPSLVVAGAAAAAVGVAFALGVAVAAPWLHGNVDIDRFRFGSAVALGVLALSILEVQIVPSDAPVALAVLGVTSVLAFDPGSDEESGPAPADDAGAATASDGGEPAPEPEAGPDPSSDDEERRGTPGIDDGERAPWL